MTIAEQATCQEKIYPRDRVDWGQPAHACGKRVKEDGLCGFHLSVKRQRAEKAEAHLAARSADQRRQDDAEARGRRLAELAGLACQPQSHWNSITRAYSGGVVLAPAQADALLALLESR